MARAVERQTRAQPTFSDQAIQFCLSIKCLFNLLLRQAMGMTQSLLHLAGLDLPVPDYSTVSQRKKTLQVAIGAVPTTTGLHLLVDSKGIKMLGEGEWKTKKHGAEYRRQWRKVHLGARAHVGDPSLEVTDNSIGDAPVLPALLDQIPVDEKIASVNGDGAYGTKGGRVMARDFNRQVAELQMRAAVLNRFTRLGAPFRFQCYKTNYE